MGSTSAMQGNSASFPHDHDTTTTATTTTTHDESNMTTNTTQAASSTQGNEYVYQQDDFILDVQNLTNASTQKSGIKTRQAHCTVFQEHTLDAEGRAIFHQFCKDNKYQMPKCGPLDPEHIKPSAGVGFVVAKPFNGINIPPITTSFAEAIETGRCGHHAIEIGSSTTVSICNNYGWTGGHDIPAAASRTNLLAKAYIEESAHHPPGPRLFVGDLNCEGATDLSHLKTLVEEHGWIDIGLHADKYGQPIATPTCKSPNATEKTRRDYIFANPEALAIIKHFYVIDDLLFPVHATLRLILRGDRVIRRRCSVQQPLSMAEFFKKEHSNLTNNIDDKGKLRVNFKQHLAPFHTQLDLAIHYGKEQLEEQLKENSMTNFYTTWSKLSEQAFQQTTGISDDDMKHFVGRGNVVFKHVTTKGSTSIAQTNDLQPEILRNHSVEVATKRFQKQASRANDWRLRLIASGRPDFDHSKEEKYEELDQHTIDALLRDTDHKQQYEHDFAVLIADPTTSALKLIFNLTKYCKHMLEIYDSKSKAAKYEGRRQRTIQLLADDPHKKKLYKKIGKNTAPPLQFLKRDKEGPHGEAPGTWTALPQEIDDITRRKWHQVFLGNVTDISLFIFTFFAKYNPYLFWRSEYKLESISAKALYDHIAKADATAGGLDGWQIDDLKLLNGNTIGWLGKMYDRIEQGAAWPAAANHAKASYLVKDEKKLDDPLSYRGLLITTLIYRIYASVRLGDMSPWIQEWALPCMFAGVPGAGAEDAAWLSALEMEHCDLHNVPVSAGGADIRKCFDAIVRQLVYFLLWLGGCPSGVLTAYRNMLEQMVIYSSIASGLGKPHRRPCGIPQGCPFSMMVIAFLMRPWLLIMQATTLKPRVLADDVFLFATGEWHVEHFTQGYTATLQYIEDIGGRTAPEKSYIVSTSEAARTWFKGFIWPVVKQKVAVVLHIRDLGAHLHTGAVHHSPTLTSRLYQAIYYVRRITYLPIDYHTKAQLIRSKILALGLYGCESVHVNETALRSLQAAIVRAIGPTTTLGSNALTFDLCSRGTDLDPACEIVTRQISLTRRMIVKWHWVQPMVKDIYQAYHHIHMPGTYIDDAKLATLRPAPPPAEGNRSAWRPSFPPKGPIGELLMSAHRMGAAFNEELVLHKHNEIPISFIAIPWQHVKPLIRDVFSRARMAYASSVRTALANAPEIDRAMFTQSVTKRTREECNILEYVATLSAWTNHHKERIGQSTTSRCPHCNKENQTIVHTIWTCATLLAKLGDHDSELVAIFQAIITTTSTTTTTTTTTTATTATTCDALLHGIPTMLSSNVDTTFWGQPLEHFQTSVQDIIGAPQKRNHIPSTAVRRAITGVQGSLFPLNARQMVQHLRGGIITFEFYEAAPCHEVPPTTPNAHSDGALKMPSNWLWGMSGFGVVWNNRNIDLQPFSDNELNYTFNSVQDKEVSLWGALPGHRSSSTRAELAAGIVSIVAPGAVHQATDSKSYLDKANIILSGVNVTIKKPWGLQTDGDLWKIWEALAKQKGFNAIRLSKVKAHTSLQDVEKGVISMFNRHYNDVSDKKATKGVQSHEHDALSVAYVFAQRHRDYHSFLKRVHNHIIKIMQKDKEERDLISKQLQPAGIKFFRPKMTIPRHLHVFNTGASRRILLRQVPPDIVIGDDLNHFEGIHTFIMSLQVYMAESDQPGISWIELLYLFEVTQQILIKPGTGDGTSLIPKASTKATISWFKHMCFRVLNMCGNKQDRILFSPARVKTNRLSAIGFSNHVPATRMQAQVQGGEDLPLVLAMLSNRMNIAENSKKLLQKGHLQFVQAKTKMRKVPTWRSCPSIMKPLARVPSQPSSSCSLESGPELPITDFKMECPECGHAKQVCNRTLIRGGKWAMITCSACKKAKKASQWKCNCHKRWYSCDVHARVGFACSRIVGENKPKVKPNLNYNHFPNFHHKGGQGIDPDFLCKFVGSEIWSELPSIRYTPNPKRVKCESQQQHAVIDNQLVFQRTGTNILARKRKWCEEREQLISDHRRRFKQDGSISGEPSNLPRPLQLIGNVKAPHSLVEPVTMNRGAKDVNSKSSKEGVAPQDLSNQPTAIPEPIKEIHNNKRPTTAKQGTRDTSARAKVQRTSDIKFIQFKLDSEGQGERGASSSSHTGDHVQDQPHTAWERVQAKFQQKFAAVRTNALDPPQISHEMLQQSPANLGQTPATPHAQPSAPPGQGRTTEIIPMRAKRKRPTASIQPARAKWVRPNPKPLQFSLPVGAILASQ